jgi:hypothetical protein
MGGIFLVGEISAKLNLYPLREGQSRGKFFNIKLRFV